MMHAMDLTDTCKALETRAADAGVSIKMVLDKAGVHRTTWGRWKSGDSRPLKDTWDSLEAAIDELAKDQGRAA
jgi:hypothetical protein